MMKVQAFKRMKDGLRKILSLHTGVELSSICGCLQLKTQQKASTSLELIMKYATELEELNEERVKRIFSFLWEGALWEYLHSIGHPVHSMAIDPRITIFKLWESGGYLEGIHNFVPHFIAREVKKRNEWVQSEDIQIRLDKLIQAQDAAKAAERKIIADHDYTNILQYFNQMSNLRSFEHSVREYLISELEIARSRIDSYEESSKMIRDQLAEMELKFMRITDQLNAQLGQCESLYDQEIEKNFSLQQYLSRLSGIVDSYIETEANREEIGGGVLQPLKLRDLQGCPFHGIREMHEKLQSYRKQRDDWDDQLRSVAREQVEKIQDLEGQLQHLQTRYDDLLVQYQAAMTDHDRFTKQQILSERKHFQQHDIMKHHSVYGWDLALTAANQVNRYREEHLKVKPLLLAGCLSGQAIVRNLCHTLLYSFHDLITSDEEKERVRENMSMSDQDHLSRKYEIAEKERLHKLSLLASVKTPKSNAKTPKGKSPSKRPGSRGDDGTVKTKASDTSKSTRAKGKSNSRPNSAAATPKKGAASPGKTSSAKKTPAKKK